MRVLISIAGNPVAISRVIPEPEAGICALHLGEHVLRHLERDLLLTQERMRVTVIEARNLLWLGKTYEVLPRSKSCRGRVYKCGHDPYIDLFAREQRPLQPIAHIHRQER